MKHFTAPSFWRCYRNLPQEVQKLTDKNFQLLKRDPRHPSLRMKKVGMYRAARVGNGYRALAAEVGNDLVWFWVGTHAEYERRIR